MIQETCKKTEIPISIESKRNISKFNMAIYSNWIRGTAGAAEGGRRGSHQASARPLVLYSHVTFPRGIPRDTRDAGLKPENHINNDRTLGIWDTAGAEKFESISEQYTRNSNTAIICYDVSDRLSFEKAKQWVSFLCSFYLVHES